MSIETNPNSWNLDYLRKRCAEESHRFFQGKDNNPRFCFEIFRKAILDQDQDAWDYIYQQYQPLVAGWVENHALYPVLSEEKDYFINRAYEKMWKSLQPAKFPRFTALNALLHYLKMCVGSVMIDHARAQERFQVEGLSDTTVKEDSSESRHDNSIEDIVFDTVHAQELWEQIKALITNRREYCVMSGSFLLGLKPREIYDTYPAEFENVQEVYRVKENLIDRLRRNQELMEYLAMYAGKKA
jgi:hypothetical protein